MRIAHPRVGIGNHVRKALGHARQHRHLRLSVVHAIQFGERKLRHLRFHDKGEMRGFRSALAVGAHDVEAEHARFLRLAHNRKRLVAPTKPLNRNALRKRASLGKRVGIRRHATRRRRDARTIGVPRCSKGQLGRVEHKLLRLHKRDSGRLGIDAHLRTQIPLRNAAVIRSLIVFARLGNRKRARRGALDRSAIAISADAIPLVGKLVACRRSVRFVLMCEHVRGSIRRNRQRGRIAFVNRRALRLRGHDRCARFGERKRKRLRCLNVFQSQGIASAGIIGNVEVVRNRVSALVGRFRRAYVIQIATAVGCCHERSIPAGRHLNRRRLNGAVFRCGAHLKLCLLGKVRDHLRVRRGSKRPTHVGAHRLRVVHRAFIVALVPARKVETLIGHGNERDAFARLYRLLHGVAAIAVEGRPLDVSAFARIDGDNIDRITHVIRGEGAVGIRRAHEKWALPDGRAVFINPAIELPSRVRDGYHRRRRHIARTRSGDDHAETRALRVRRHLRVEARRIEHRGQAHVLVRNTRMDGVVAHNRARIVDPVREAHSRIGNGHGDERIALVARKRGSRTRRTGDKCKTPEYRALRHRHVDLACGVGFELRIISDVGRRLEGKHVVGLRDAEPALVKAPANEAVAFTCNRLQRSFIPRLEGTCSFHLASARAHLARNDDFRRHRHLIRIGELSLDGDDVIGKGAYEFLVKGKPAVRVGGEKRLLTAFAHKLPGDEALVGRLLSVQLDRVAKRIRSPTCKHARTFLVRVELHVVGIAREARHVGDALCYRNRVFGKSAHHVAFSILPAIEGEARLRRGGKRRAVALRK